MAGRNQASPKANQDQGRLGDRLEQIYTGIKNHLDSLQASHKVRFAVLDKNLDGLNGKVDTVGGEVKGARNETKSDQKAYDSKIRDIERKVQDVERKIEKVIEKLERVMPENLPRAPYAYPPMGPSNNYRGFLKEYGRR